MGKKRNDRTPETAYNVGGESSSTSNALNSTPGRKYDVFLSFAGKDTRLKFTDHLYHALRRVGINAFRDNEGIERGEVITQQLIQAIKDSLCAVVVLSENYAESKWCLDELQMILKCKEELGQKVFPIFYGTDPSDVRHKRQKFGQALAKYEERFVPDKVQQWRNALSEISHLSGWDTRDMSEAELIEDIVAKLWTYLSSKIPSYFDDNLVGIESRVHDMMTILEIELDDTRFVGIWGMGGVGKTTLARVVYKRICHVLSNRFDVCCFIANVRDTSQKEGLVSVQKKLLSHLKIKGMEISDEYEGKEMIKRHLLGKKVLLVLDNLDGTSQLENLAGSLDWFGKGSRILITTRDSHLLTASGVQGMYDMKTMTIDESLQLFSKKAFKKDYPKIDYLELSKSVVKYAGYLPLALQALGSFLCGRSEDEWRDALDRLKKIPDKNILQVLKISYDGLNEKEKDIFLDVACFFRHWQKKKVTQILKSCDLHPIIGIKVLIEKALLVETNDGRLDMHDLIEELGRDIVHQESPNDVCKRSRLWKLKDIKEVLENNIGSNAIRAIVMEDDYWNRGRIEVHPEAFSQMSSIRLLMLKDKNVSRLILPSGFKLPGKLKVVEWPSYPSEALAPETPLNEVVHVKMHHSRIKKFWDSIQLMNMTFMDLSNSECLSETPDFSGVPCLQHLCLRWCTSLVKVHPSLGELKELVEVDLHGCRKLQFLPKELKTNSLEKLDLGWCEEVEMLPKFGEGMKKLSYLDVNEAAITELPESFGSLTGLRDLNLSGCKIINLDALLKIHVTRQISGLNVVLLTKLDLSWCGLNDGSIPDDFGSLSSLIILDLSHNHFVNLPTTCFSSLFRLLYLSLDSCKNLKSLPRLPPRLIRLDASHCDSMENLSSGRKLWNLVASLDHKYRRQTGYVITDEEYDVISEEEYDDTVSMFKRTELEDLPLRDFFANVPGYQIPSWFPKKCAPSIVLDDDEYVYEIGVQIPPSFRESEWCGIVVCLHISGYLEGWISWSSKAPEDDDYILKKWAHRSTLGFDQNRHLCIMVLELNEKTCWQHLKAPGNYLHIKLHAHNDCRLFALDRRRPISRFKCGFGLFSSKERKQKRCNDNDFNQLTQSQLASPHDEINLPSGILNKFIAEAYERVPSIQDTQESEEE